MTTSRLCRISVLLTQKCYHQPQHTFSSCAKIFQNNPRTYRLRSMGFPKRPTTTSLYIRLYSNHNIKPPQQNEEKKFHPVHPKVIQRLAAIEESTRFHGYSTLRIGAVVILLSGIGLYIFRGYIRQNVAGEVSTVATMSLGDAGVKMKVHELAVALIQAILTNENVQKQTVKFLQDVFNKPVTRDALISLLIQVLNDPKAQDKMVSTLKHILEVSLGDEKFRQQLARNIRHLLQDQNTKEGLLELLRFALNEERVQAETKKFLQDVIASKPVREEAGKLGKHVVHDVVSDATVQQRVGASMWTAFTYSVTPRLFGGGGSPHPSDSNSSKDNVTSKEPHNIDSTQASGTTAGG